MITWKLVASSTFSVALGLASCTPTFAQGLSAQGAGEVEVAPKDTTRVGGDVRPGEDEADTSRGSQADDAKGVGDANSQTNSERPDSQ